MVSPSTGRSTLAIEHQKNILNQNNTPNVSSF